MTNPSTSISSPITVYIVHHPKCKDGLDLSKKLYNWFRLGYLTGDASAAGLPVYFRRKVAPANEKAKPEVSNNTTASYQFSPVIDFERAQVNVIILLVDQNLVADVTWRKAVEALVRSVSASEPAKELSDKSPSPKTSSSKTIILPAAMHASFFQTGPLYDNHNFVRLLDMSVDQMEIALRRAATEAMARWLLNDRPEPNLKPINIFLSHAKRDGEKIAMALRDGIRKCSQLTAWFDSNDLPYGAHWKEPMERAAEGESSAMVVALTDAYPTRPWCRKEAALSRTPRKTDGIWTVRPVVAVVQSGMNWVRGVPMLDGVTRIGWNDIHQAQMIEHVVDRVVLEILLAEVHRRIAMHLKKMISDRNRGGSRSRLSLENTCIITWVPDAWTLAQVRSMLSKRASAKIKHIVYPGFGLTEAELQELDSITSMFSSKPSLMSYEQVFQELDLIPLASESGRLRIALSASGVAEELADEGIGIEHIEEFMIRLAMNLFKKGHQLAFGGVLSSDPTKKLTENLIDTAKSWMAISNVKAQDLETETRPAVDVNDDATWPMVNYVPWPECRNLSIGFQAQLTGICKFVTVDQSDDDAKLVATLKDEDFKKEDEPRIMVLSANAVSKMRLLSSEQTDLRIVSGGKITGWRGWMPGIFEEIGYSLQMGKCVVVLGSLGGISGVIADFLKSKDNEWPKELSLTPKIDLDNNQFISPKRSSEIRNQFEEFKQLLINHREFLHSSTGELAQALRDCLSETTPRKIVHLILRILDLVTRELKESSCK